MLNWIARHDTAYGLGSDPEAIWERYFAATDTPEATLMARYAWTATGLAGIAFSHSAAYPPAAALISLIIEEGEAATGTVDPAEATARIIDQLPDFSDEQRAGAHAVLAAQLVPPPGEPGETVQDTYNYVIDFTKCTDGQWVQGQEYWEEFNETTARQAPFSAQLGLLDLPQICAFWPNDSAMPEVGESFPETIVLQSELDSMTPYEQGHAAATGLPNTSLIAVDNENVHGIFPYGTAEVDRPVFEFLLGGDRPEQTIVAAGKPMTLEETTFESWSPLDGTGDHDGDIPAFTDPTVPAETGALAEATG